MSEELSVEGLAAHLAKLQECSECQDQSVMTEDCYLCNARSLLSYLDQRGVRVMETDQTWPEIFERKLPFSWATKHDIEMQEHYQRLCSNAGFARVKRLPGCEGK